MCVCVCSCESEIHEKVEQQTELSVFNDLLFLYLFITAGDFLFYFIINCHEWATAPNFLEIFTRKKCNKWFSEKSKTHNFSAVTFASQLCLSCPIRLLCKMVESLQKILLTCCKFLKLDEKKKNQGLNISLALLFLAFFHVNDRVQL